MSIWVWKIDSKNKKNKTDNCTSTKPNQEEWCYNCTDTNQIQQEKEESKEKEEMEIGQVDEKNSNNNGAYWSLIG